MPGALLSSSGCATEDSPATADPTASKWRVRARVIGVIPDEDSSRIHLAAGGADISLAAGVATDNNVVPERDLT